MTTTMPPLLLHMHPTTENASETSIREEFYDQLNGYTSELKNNNHLLLVVGDLNANAGSAYPRFSESMGKFGKGISNSNGEHLLEYTMQNDRMLLPQNG